MKTLKLVIVIAIIAMCGFAWAGEPVEVIPPQNKVLGSGNGRYVFGQINNARRDQYMLDTQTGRLWQIVKDKDGVTLLQSVAYIGVYWGENRFTPDDRKTVENENSLLYEKAKKIIMENYNNKKDSNK